MMVDDSSSDEDNHDGAEEEEEGEKDTCEEESLLWVEEDQSAKDVTATTLDEAFLATLHALPSTARYPVPEENIEFILVDLQLRGDKVHGTCVELFGRAADGGSVYVLLHGWYPYLYVPAPSGWVDTLANKDCLCLALQEALGSALEQDPLQQHARRILYQFASPIVKVEAIVATSIMGFDAFEEQQLFLKIHVISPLLIAPLRTLLEKQQKTLCMLPHGAPAVVEGGRGTRTFNSNLDPILQFMVDLQLSGCQWCRVPYGQQEEEGSTRSRCRYEVRCGVEALRLLHCETQRSDLGPLRVLSFDLEAAGRKGVFPDPAIDPVIQIAMHTNIEGLQPILLSFQECAPIEGASVLSFEREESLLLGFRDIVLSFDPDILTGYNICNFDLEYLQKRAEALGIGLEFSLMTRVLAPSSKKRGQQGDAERKGPEHMHVRELYFQSAQVGKRKTNRVSLRGRVVLDVYPWMLNNFRLEEYKLDSVCRMYLPSGMTKEDLHFTEITPKWQAGPDGRQELGVYCLKDAELPLALIHALSILFNAVERARVIGIPMEYVLNRGNLVRFTSQLMRESMARGFVLPYVDQASPLRQDATKYKGATVMAVKPGIWENVAVLDFSSMYPSIIIASNLCYSTLYMRGPCRGQPLRYQGHSFVDSSTRCIFLCFVCVVDVVALILFFLSSCLARALSPTFWSACWSSESWQTKPTKKRRILSKRLCSRRVNRASRS
jgi:DNA polymerase delta subunit 1